ncbi:MAG: beta-ketoacyl synthase N-terminal-like domain-containing protein, partial [Isosphaeraceae bacterium]
MYAGVIAVPAYPPRPNRPMDRLAAIVEDAGPAAVLTCSSLGREAGRWTAELGRLAGADLLFTDRGQEAGGPGVDDLAASWVDPGVSADSLAFLQYTSGSTAAPRGVMITHGNLLANSAAIRSIFGSGPGERGVSWLPLFHDMGLIGGVIQTLYCGGAMTLLSPVSFLQRPLRWLEAIDRAGASISGAPNFAFELCIERTTPEQRAALDLSGWRVAFNGAEPIRAETLDRFAEAFAPAGFRREAFLPCYGLAEATLMVCGHRQAPGRRASILAVDGQALARGEAAEAIDPARSTRLAASGRVADGHIVAVVDPADERSAVEGRVGEVWVSGPSVAAGYWNRPEDSVRVMEARLPGHEGRTFLRTGDLGFLRDGELYVTGRIKDLIVLRGRNVYPQDVEWAAGRSHPALRPDGTAAVAIEQGGRERLAIVAEAERRLAGASPEEIFAAIRGAVAEAVEAEVAAIRLLRPASLPRTSSGKVRRHACREALLAGTLKTVAAWTMADDAGEVAGDEAAPQAPTFEPGRDDPAAGSPRRLEIAAWLAAKIAGPLGVRPEEVDVRAPLASFGIGSLRAVRLAAELEEWLGRSLPATLVYDHPTIETLAAFLADEPAMAATATATGTSVAREPAEPLITPGREPIAIIGIGCRFPGADGPTAYWELLRSGMDAIGEVPPGRWTEAELRGLDFSRRGGFVSDADHFDAAFFGITPREAVDIDPQQRMLLEVAWEAIEDAGQVPERLAGGAVGVFIGISTGDYALRNSVHRGGLAGHQIIGNAGCIAANRISHFFDFCGPSLAIDTACSSSLVAIHMACRSLRDGETEVAIAGGVNLLLDPRVFAALAQGRFLSPDGRCRAFDASANGYVRGEGAGLVVLKPLSRALADGDPIYAVIRGGAVNQNGRTVGLTAPNRAAQEAVLRAACRHAGIQPGQVDYVEAHGTGTPLGDPIELSALGAVLGEGRRDDRSCLIGSAKTNIGHLEAAAGVGGLIKAALAIHHRTIPASLHYTSPNPHADLAGSPLRVAAVPQPWPATDSPARAGVSSFGFGGTNAHLILEEAPQIAADAECSPAGVDADAEDVVIPISARDPEALEKLCRSYRGPLAGSEAIRLGDLAHSAGARRGHLNCRIALVVADREEAMGALSAFLIGEPHVSVMEGRRAPGLRPGPVLVLPDRPAASRRAVRELIRREPEFRA